MSQFSCRLLTLTACVALIALLGGCVSSVNEDYAVTGPKQTHALGKTPITQSFVAVERNLDAVQVMIRLKSATTIPVPVRVGFILVDTGTRKVIARSVKAVALTGSPQSVRFAFPVQAGSRGKAYEFALTDARAQRETDKPLLVLASGRDSYPKGQAGGRDSVGAGHDLHFRTEIAISAGTALRSFAGRLLGDKTFLAAYGLLLISLCLALAKAFTASAGR